MRRSVDDSLRNTYVEWRAVRDPIRFDKCAPPEARPVSLVAVKHAAAATELGCESRLLGNVRYIYRIFARIRRTRI